MALDHRVHGERNGDDLSRGDGPAHALALGQRLDRLHGPTAGRAVGTARLVDLP